MAMVERSPPGPSYAPSVSSNVDEFKCLCCNEIMDFEAQECYVIVICNHIFHRVCIEQALSISGQCPFCNEVCQLSDLNKYFPVPPVINEIGTQTDVNRKTRPTIRGKARGAMANRPTTRSLSKNLYKDNNNFSMNVSPQRPHTDLMDRMEGSPNHNRPEHPHVPTSVGIQANQVPSTGNMQNSNQIDYARINVMIESCMSKMFENMNIRHNPPIPVPPTDFVPRLTAQSLHRLPNAQPFPPGPSNVRSGSNHDREVENFVAMRPEKATSIIQNWNIKFSGSSSGLTVEEFLYRIKSLTAEHF